MKIYYDSNNRPDPVRVYLATSYEMPLCLLNGIKEETFSLTRNVNNTHELSFDVERFIEVDGELVESNGYEWLSVLMKVYIDGIGWFVLGAPTVSNDGKQETKSCRAQSCEIEMQQHDINQLKINCGTTDSYEMLVEDNVEIIDDVEFAKNQIKFYNPDNPDLSFLDIVLNVSGLKGWSVGYVDPIPHEYRSYVDGELTYTYTALPDEIGTFDVDQQDLYSFLTQDVERFYNCIFVFDILKRKINAYRPENLGKDTNINIGFRNIQESNEIEIDEENIHTRFMVSGSDDLGITYVNFGSNQIEELSDYFLNEKYLSRDTIDKYKLWKADIEQYRIDYIENTRIYNEQQAAISELTNRVPLDGTSTDWSTFTDNELLEAQANYLAQKWGYESFYVDDNNEFDIEYIKESKDWNDYNTIITDILPSIRIEIGNRYAYLSVAQLTEIKLEYAEQVNYYEMNVKGDDGLFNPELLAPNDYNDWYQLKYIYIPEIESVILDKTEQGSSYNPEDAQRDYIDYWETNWDLYGLDELDVKLKTYKNVVEVCRQGRYDVPYYADSGHTEDYHNEMYQKYIDALYQMNLMVDDDGSLIDVQNEDSCQTAREQRQAEIDAHTAIQEVCNGNRKGVVESISKETWITEGEDGEEISFTEQNLYELSKLYIDTGYSNDNMFLTSSDDSVSAIDEQLKLMDAAQLQLSIDSQPQYTYTTTLDNFLALYDYEEYTSELNEGDYIYLGIRDDQVVKLRVMSIQFNPMTYDDDITITFSNMIKSASGRDDFSFLLDSASNTGKSSGGSSASQDYLLNEGIGLTAGLIQKLVSSGAFKNAVSSVSQDVLSVYGSQIVAGTGGSGGTISVDQLNAKMIEVLNLTGQNAYFEYLRTKLISTDSIVADNAEFQTLSSMVGSIDNLLAGNVVADLEHVITLTAENVNIDEAVIKDLIAANITVAMLQAGDISADSFNIKSDDGGFALVGNTMQFKDKDGNLRIQIGRDAEDNFTFTLYDADGSGVLIDEDGIHESAISDGLIVNDMIADGTIEKDKLGFPVVDTDENGNVSITKILDDTSGDTLGAIITQIKKDIEDTGNQIENTYAYSIVLENEYQNIPCLNGTVKEGFLIEIPFTAYKGTTRVGATVAASNIPTGITIAENIATTTESTGKLTLNVASGATLGSADTLMGYITLTFTIDGQTFIKRFTWSKTNDGDSANAIVYILEPSTNIITKVSGESTTYSPTSVTFSAYTRTGTNRNAYAGRFVISTSANGSSFSNVYSSTTDEASHQYTLSGNVAAIRCQLYASGGVTNLIEQTTVAVLEDSGQIRTEFTTIKDSITEISNTVDKNTQAISEKVTQTQVETLINNYDGSTIKTLRDSVAEHTTTIGTITDSVSSLETVINGDGEVEGLTERLSTVETTANGILQTVSETYATKGEVETVESSFSQHAGAIETEIKNARGDSSTLKQRIDGISSEVINSEGFVTQIEQTAGGIVLQAKQDIKQDIADNYVSNETFDESMNGSDGVNKNGKAYSIDVTDDYVGADINKLCGETIIVDGELRSATTQSVVSELGTLNTYNLANEYFPNGMRSAGDVYDELDLKNRIAIQRVGSVDLGSLNWSYSSISNSIYSDVISDIKKPIYNVLTGMYYNVSGWQEFINKDMVLYNTDTAGRLYIRDSRYTDASSFKSAMQGVPLYYELAEPITTPITEVFDNYIPVEQGGTITFKSDQDEMGLHIPINYDVTFRNRGVLESIEKNREVATSISVELGKVNLSVIGDQIAELQIRDGEIESSISGQTDSLDKRITENTSSIQTMSGALNAVNKTIEGMDGTITSKFNSLIAQESDKILSKVEDDLSGNFTQIEQDTEVWKAMFRNIGMSSDGVNTNNSLSTSVVMSADGLKTSQGNQETLMTPSAFIGKYDNKEVFKIEKDLTTIEGRIEVHNGIDFTNIKYVNLSLKNGSKTVKCLAHVASGGTS